MYISNIYEAPHLDQFSFPILSIKSANLIRRRYLIKLNNIQKLFSKTIKDLLELLELF